MLIKRRKPEDQLAELVSDLLRKELRIIGKHDLSGRTIRDLSVHRDGPRIDVAITFER